MKPIERSGHIDMWILVQQGTTGTFNLQTLATSEYGLGFCKTLEQAQHHQTMELLKGNKVEVFHLEWPLK
jgi:hypothetical protein